MLRVTLDTGAVGPERKRIEAACAGHEVDLANTTVTERELEGTKIAPLSKPILETGVWGESRWDTFVWGGDEPVLEMILDIIGDPFPPPGQRDDLKEGRLRQLRDAMILEAHVREKRDIFVTTDATGFVKHGRREKLEALCSTLIMTVDEFCHYIAQSADPASAGVSTVA